MSFLVVNSNVSHSQSHGHSSRCNFYFDEPLSNLDAKLRESVRFEIKQLSKQYNLTSIYVTHDQAEALTMSDKIIVLNKGAIEQIGSPQDIYHHPKNRFVADFIGIANITEANVKNIGDNLYAVSSIFGDFTVFSEKKTGIRTNLYCFVPEDIELLPNAQNGSGKPNYSRYHQHRFYGQYHGSARSH